MNEITTEVGQDCGWIGGPQCQLLGGSEERWRSRPEVPKHGLRIPVSHIEVIKSPYSWALSRDGSPLVLGEAQRFPT